jgi:hypothetical protein
MKWLNTLIALILGGVTAGALSHHYNWSIGASVAAVLIGMTVGGLVQDYKQVARAFMQAMCEVDRVHLMTCRGKIAPVWAIISYIPPVCLIIITGIPLALTLFITHVVPEVLCRFIRFVEFVSHTTA